VAFDAAGKTDFSSLQAALKRGGTGLVCFAFDLLWLDGEDLRAQPLIARKARLEALLGKGSAPLTYSTHVQGHAAQALQQICAAGHEGIVAKRADARYRSERARSWLKVKCTKSQEFVVGGFRPSDKRGRPFSSLLVGVIADGQLAYKGRVGAFEGETLAELGTLLAQRLRKTSPFGAMPRDAARDARYVRPDLVVEVGFTEFTREGFIRHGVLKGLRATWSSRCRRRAQCRPTLTRPASQAWR